MGRSTELSREDNLLFWLDLDLPDLALVLLSRVGVWLFALTSGLEEEEPFAEAPFAAEGDTGDLGEVGMGGAGRFYRDEMKCNQLRKVRKLSSNHNQYIIIINASSYHYT